MAANLKELVQRYTADQESVYNTWFIDNETRMKAFRSIRRGVIEVIDAIKAGTFGNDFKKNKGTSLKSCAAADLVRISGASP